MPPFFTICNIRCKVWYKDQPTECDICHDNHRAANCPLKGRCLHCRQEGHFARACPNDPWENADDSVDGSVAAGWADPTPAEAATPLPPPPAADSVDLRDNELSVSQPSQSILVDVSFGPLSQSPNLFNSDVGEDSMEAVNACDVDI